MPGARYPPRHREEFLFIFWSKLLISISFSFAHGAKLSYGRFVTARSLVIMSFFWKPVFHLFYPFTYRVYFLIPHWLCSLSSRTFLFPCDRLRNKDRENL